MHRWELAHGHTGANAPSWLTFEVHRPYFDGADSPLTTVHARGSLFAARRFEQRAPTAPRFGMTMPGSYRTLLDEESRLSGHRVTDPTELPPELASPTWSLMAEAYAHRADLDTVDRVGLAHWLLAVCLPHAVCTLFPLDRNEAECADPVTAAGQWARASALFAVAGLSDHTRAAYAPLVDNPAPTTTHAQAVAAWGYLLARHAGDDAAAPALFARAGQILKGLDLTAFERALLHSRLLLRQVVHAERQHAFDHAWQLLAEAEDVMEKPADPDEEALAVEMRRRIVDRSVDIAVRRGDTDAESRLITEGLALDPYDVKIRMQAAQADERRGDDEAALAGYLDAARLGPYGTAFALLAAARRAGALGHDEFARVLVERAHRVAPRSERVRLRLAELSDPPLAEVLQRPARHPHESNWHYRMYAAYFNLGESGSPCLYAALPTLAHGFAEAGAPPEVNWQRLMPPAFRANLVRESGLAEFAVAHPADLPAPLRTPAWERLCAWVAEFPSADAERQYLTAMVLFRLGFGKVVLDLIPPRPTAELTTPAQLRLWHWRDVVAYVGSVGSGAVHTPTASFEIAEHPACPTHLRFVIAVFAVVFHARETKSLEDAAHWRDRAQESLDELLADDARPPFEKAMLESRFYRSVTYVPFLRRDREQLVAEMDRAEELARSVRPSTPYEEFLARENLRACLESRSKEAFAFGEHERGRRLVAKVLTIDPYEPKTHMELAEVLLAEGREREAGESYLRTARLGPIGTARGYALAGECFDRAGLPVLAEDCFAQALRVDPYAVSAARGWARVASGALVDTAAAYARDLLAWGAARGAR
ncbi:tetratricopeptide repeat protein [Actinokineospora sp. 24-640]